MKTLNHSVAYALGILLFFGVLLEPSTAFAVEVGADISKGFHNSKPVAIMFWAFALGTLGGAIFVITRRNMVAAVMGMVGTFFAIAGLYLMLYASFLAVMQVLVYAGAIMVLFVFVIMMLNRPEHEPWALQGLLGKAFAGVGMVYLFVRLAQVLWAVKDNYGALGKPVAVVKTLIINGEQVSRVYDFGTVKGIGYTLFTHYLFPFEAVSIVLLVAVVGAITIARPKPSEQPMEDAS